MAAQLMLQTAGEAWAALTLSRCSSLINKPYCLTLIVGTSFFFFFSTGLFNIYIEYASKMPHLHQALQNTWSAVCICEERAKKLQAAFTTCKKVTPMRIVAWHIPFLSF